MIPIKEIPEQNSPEDLWTIFNKVNDCLEDGDSVIFDITHSFRSVPIVALLAISYFRVVRSIKIEALLYGAFEAQENGVAPSFDLLPVVRLFDWLTATDQFLKTGNGQDLATLLQEAGGHTKELGDRILEISQGLELLRPMDVMKAAAALPENIKRAKPDLAKVVPPFEMLLNRVVDEYGKFSVSDPENHESNGKTALQKHLFEIEWCTRKGLYVQAISLAREWLPSLLCYSLNVDPLDEHEREKVELLLSGGKNPKTGQESPYLEKYMKIPKKRRGKICTLWSQPPYKLAHLRNDVLHSGFRKNPKSAFDIKEMLNGILEQLSEIAVMWEILDKPT